MMPKGVPGSGPQRQTKLETLRRHADKLRAKLAELEAQTEAHDIERHRLMGRIIEAYARDNQEFEAQLRVILAGTALSRDERKLLGLPATAGGRGRPRRVDAAAE